MLLALFTRSMRQRCRPFFNLKRDFLPALLCHYCFFLCGDNAITFLKTAYCEPPAQNCACNFFTVHNKCRYYRRAARLQVLTFFFRFSFVKRSFTHLIMFREWNMKFRMTWPFLGYVRPAPAKSCDCTNGSTLPLIKLVCTIALMRLY